MGTLRKVRRAEEEIEGRPARRPKNKARSSNQSPMQGDMPGKQSQISIIKISICYRSEEYRRPEPEAER